LRAGYTIGTAMSAYMFASKLWDYCRPVCTCFNVRHEVVEDMQLANVMTICRHILLGPHSPDVICEKPWSFLCIRVGTFYSML
jgi:hypothetical protein